MALPEKIAVVVPLENGEYERLYDEQICAGWLDITTEVLIEQSCLMALGTIRGYWLVDKIRDSDVRLEVLKDSAKRMAELFKTYNVFHPRYQWTDVRCVHKDEVILSGSVLARELQNGDFNYQRR